MADFVVLYRVGSYTGRSSGKSLLFVVTSDSMMFSVLNLGEKIASSSIFGHVILN